MSVITTINRLCAKGYRVVITAHPNHKGVVKVGLIHSKHKIAEDTNAVHLPLELDSELKSLLCLIECWSEQKKASRSTLRSLIRAFDRFEAITEGGAK